MKGTKKKSKEWINNPILFSIFLGTVKATGKEIYTHTFIIDKELVKKGLKKIIYEQN